jgi:hypothetical protein
MNETGVLQDKIMKQKLRQFAIKMGRTSLLNKVMDMDDEILEMMTVETKQTTISHNQTFLHKIYSPVHLPVNFHTSNYQYQSTAN